MSLIERTEYNIYEGDDEYGEAVSWHHSLEEANAKWSEEGHTTETHCIVKVTYYCTEYEVVT